MNNMINCYDHNYFVDNCMFMIDTEIDSYYNNCLKSAYTYSILISQNQLNHDKTTFNNMVYSQIELENIIKKITFKINEMVNNYCYESLPINFEFINKNSEPNSILNQTIIESKKAEKISKVCEYIIDKSLCKIYDIISPNFVIKLFMEEVKFSKRLLGKNTKKHLTLKHQNEIYNQLKGFLINEKVKLRNQLRESLYSILEDISDKIILTA